MLTVVLIGLWLAYGRPWESARQRAYRECEPCGVGAAAVDKWIDNARHSTLDRDGLVELYLATFEDRAEAELCRPCVDAVLDAAGR